MKIIEGTNVDLITPFPVKEIPRVFGWSRCFYTFSENDDVPKGQEEFGNYIGDILSLCPSMGVVDKNQLTSQRHEAPLVGVVLFEPAGPHQLYLHFASARRAFKVGLMDEALELAIKTIFNGSGPGLTRIASYIDEHKGPVKWVLKNQGFRCEGVCRDAVVKDGVPRNLVYYGLTRREWEVAVVVPPVIVEEVEVSTSAPTLASTSAKGDESPQ